MAEGLVSRLRSLCQELGRVDPALLGGQDARVLAEELATAAKVCAGVGARVAARAASCGAHRAVGYRDGAQWLARVSGTTAAQAGMALEVADAVEGCPVTKDALMAGTLSLGQAHEITRTEAACGGSEAELVALARGSDVKTLRDTARSRRLRSFDAEELYARQRGARGLWHWRDSEGMVCIRAALSPDVGMAVVNRLDATAASIRRQARRQGCVDPYPAHAADALVALVNGAGATTAPGRVELNLVCDVGAWGRGYTVGEEVSAIVGGGPIPVRVLRELAAGAFVKGVLHDGVQIHAVAHFGRHIPAEVRTALGLGDPPRFEGMTCAEPGCGRGANLELDHVDPLANGGPTSFANLEPRCWVHHQEKTERDRRAGLLGGSHDTPDPAPD